MGQGLTEDGLRQLVLVSIKKNNDLHTLEETALEYAGENHTKAFVENTVDFYLDRYNTYMHKSKLFYRGDGKFLVRGPQSNISRATALWDTYIKLLENTNLNTSNWSFNPSQQKLL